MEGRHVNARGRKKRMPFPEKQVTGWDGNSSDPPNASPEEAFPHSNDFPSPRRRIPANWGSRSRHLKSSSQGNRDLPTSDTLSERQCWLAWKVAPLPTEQLFLAQIGSYLTISSHISKQARPEDGRQYGTPETAECRQSTVNFPQRRCNDFYPGAPADPTQMATSGSLRANISCILCSWCHSKRDLGRDPDMSQPTVEG